MTPIYYPLILVTSFLMMLQPDPLNFSEVHVTLSVCCEIRQLNPLDFSYMHSSKLNIKVSFQ